MRHTFLRLAAVAAAAASTACLDLALISALDTDEPFCEASSCAWFDVQPAPGFRFLRGDTVTFRVWSEPTFRTAHWTATGAVRIAYGDTLATDSRRPDSINVIRGTVRGVGTLRVRSAAPGAKLERLIQVSVVDSIEVNGMDLPRVVQMVRRGDSLTLWFNLRAGGDWVHGQPTAWSVSDSGKGVVVRTAVRHFGPTTTQTWFRAGADTGLTWVRAHFLAIRDSTPIRVLP